MFITSNFLICIVKIDELYVNHISIKLALKRQMNLIDIIRAFNPKAAGYTYFSNEHRMFSRVDHILGHKTNLKKFKKIEIISSIFYENNAMKLEII